MVNGAARRLRALLGVLLAACVIARASAQELDVTITYLGRNEPPTIPLTLAEPVLEDIGI